MKKGDILYCKKHFDCFDHPDFVCRVGDKVFITHIEVITKLDIRTCVDEISDTDTLVSIGISKRKTGDYCTIVKLITDDSEIGIRKTISYCWTYFENKIGRAKRIIKQYACR